MPSGEQNCRHFRKRNRQKDRRKIRQIGGADQKKKHMVVEFFNASWRVLMGNTIGKVSTIGFSLFVARDRYAATASGPPGVATTGSRPRDNTGGGERLHFSRFRRW